MLLPKVVSDCVACGDFETFHHYSKNFLNDLKFVTVLYSLKLLSLHLLNFLPSEAVLKDLSHTISPHYVEAISLKGICCLNINVITSLSLSVTFSNHRKLMYVFFI